MLPAVTVEDVAAYAPGAPVVTAEQVAEAADWAEDLYARRSVTLPEPGTRAERELKRGIMAYALGLAPAAVAYAAGLSDGRLSKLKDGDQELTFSLSDAVSIGEAGLEFESRAYDHLRRAGYPFPVRAAGASL